MTTRERLEQIAAEYQLHLARSIGDDVAFLHGIASAALDFVEKYEAHDAGWRAIRESPPAPGLDELAALTASATRLKEATRAWERLVEVLGVRE